ncbi:MAG: hypothetical protein JO270_16695 [Acidobacteriaceae bacterium]|nr:hypothetical protein [Acidobacteriaceae bacterium]MBV8570768.1 hypothetical protein [Acidobacteriaceae bacterium]
MRRRGIFAAALTMLLTSCGYHTGGKADLLPKSVQTISIPAFASLSTRYKLNDELPEAIAREFNTRTRFRVVDNPANADAVLNGRINTVQANPVVLDPSSGKATSVQLSVALTITLVQRTTGKVLFSRTNWLVRTNYEVSVYPQQYFDESGPAMDRLSRDVAHDVVSGIVENF